MFYEQGKQVNKAEPATPVELLGLNSVPQAGDTLTVVADERRSHELIRERQQATALSLRSVSLSNLYAEISAGELKELNAILKTDVQGSIEPIRTSLERLGTDRIKVKIIHSGTGNVTESDVMLAVASKGLIIGFGSGIEVGAKRMAEAEGVDVRFYKVIYNLVDDIDKALKGMLEPTYVEVIEGQAEVRAIFLRGKGQKVAGVFVTEGKITRGASVRVRRGQQTVFESSVSSLRRFKDDVKEVATGYEAGVGVKDFTDFEVGDRLEFYRREQAGG